MSFLRRALMGRSSRRRGAGWAGIIRQSLHKSLLIARSQKGPICSLNISKFRTPAPPLPKPVKSVHRQVRKSSNFVPSDGPIFMQTFALTLFKHPARPEPQRTCKVCIHSSPKTPIFAPDGIQTSHTPTPPKTSPLLQLHGPQDADLFSVQALLNTVENVHVDGTFVAQAFEYAALVGDHGESQCLHLPQEGLQL